MGLFSVRDAIERYAHAVQQADVDELRKHPWRATPPENTQLSVAKLAADTCQHGSSTVSDFRDVSFDPEQCMITVPVNCAVNGCAIQAHRIARSVAAHRRRRSARRIPAPPQLRRQPNSST